MPITLPGASGNVSAFDSGARPESARTAPHFADAESEGAQDPLVLEGKTPEGAPLLKQFILNTLHQEWLQRMAFAKGCLLAFVTESRLHAGESLKLEVPGSINRYLREYQRDGIRFLFRQYAFKQGGILADDMGLGKVLQTFQLESM
jgi:hypothetical protein